MNFVPDQVRVSFPNDELACRVILGEAANQGEIGMLAVAAVIQNRLRRGFWYGRDVADVCRATQFNGFDPVTPLASPVYSTAAMVWAIAKEGGDPTHGALFYANPPYSEAEWARNLSLKNALQIGAHFFTDNVNGVPFAHSGVVVDPHQNANAFAP